MEDQEEKKVEDDGQILIVDEFSQPQVLESILIAELPGHTETVEFVKFDKSGQWLVTGGMNNVLRIWDAEKNYALHRTLDDIP
jgi:WD40 repeat protein